MSHRKLADRVAYCREQVRRGLSTCQELARELGVSEKAVQAAVYGHTYTNIPGALKSPRRPAKRRRTTRLTTEEVLEIREAYAAGELPVAEVAKQYGITASYVVRIGRGDARTDVPGAITTERRPVRRPEHRRPVHRGEKHPMARLDALCVVAIRELVRLGAVQSAIADVFGTTAENVSMIARRLRWKHVPDMPLTPTALKHLPPRAVELFEKSSLAQAS